MNSSKDIIYQFYTELNRNDVEAAMKLFDPSVFRYEFQDLPATAHFQGLEAVRANFTRGRNTWAEGACTPIEFLEVANKYIVIAHVKVRLKNETQWIDGKVADGFSLKKGLISEFHSFATKEKALAWAQSSK